MTLSTRNRFLTAAFIITLPAIVSVLTALPKLAAIAAKTIRGASQRPAVLMLTFIRDLLPASWIAVVTAILVCSIFAAATIVVLYYSFEKTKSAEILFFAVFVFSFAAEVCRISVPLAQYHDWSAELVVYAARLLLFARFWGVLSIFASGVYASGIDYQKHGRVLLVITFMALIIATGAPVDGFNYDTSFTLLSGYSGMFGWLDFFLVMVSGVSYLVAAYSRGAKEFYLTAAGIFLMAAGRQLLFRGDAWVAVALGTLMLTAGAWLFAKKVHSYYLWL